MKAITLGGLGLWALVDAVSITLMSDEEFDRKYNTFL